MMSMSISSDQTFRFYCERVNGRYTVQKVLNPLIEEKKNY